MGKVCLVTGASRGIGRLICEALAERGHQVCAGVRQAKGGEYQLDVTDRRSIEAAVSRVISEHGRLDVLVNNAGYGLMGPIEMATDAEIQQQFDVNVFGVIRMIQAVLPQMRKQRSGRIVNIGSISGIFSPPIQGLYAATKHAVEAITQSLALSIEPWNIDAVLVNPGFVATEFFEKRAATSRSIPGDPYARYVAHLEKIYQAGHEAGQDPAEVAATVVSVVEADRPNPRNATSPEALELMASKLVDPSGKSDLARMREHFSLPLPAS